MSEPSEKAPPVVEPTVAQAAEPTPAPVAVAEGSPLAVARVAAGLSIADVGRQLKLSGWQVEALESGDYKRLPGPVFVRGFIRNYARLLKIDPAPLLADIAGPAQPVPVTPAAPAPTEAIPFPGQQGFAWKPYALGALVVVAGLVGYEIFGEDLLGTSTDSGSVELPQAKVVAESKPLELPTPAAVDVEPPKSAVTLPTAAPVAPAAVVAAPPVQARPADKVTPPVVKPPEAVLVAPSLKPAPAADVKAPISPKTAEVAAPAAKPATEPRIMAADERVVRMVFSRESWVEIRDRQGRTIFSQLNPAGSAQSVSGQPPLRLVVGNATGVRLLYNDRSIDLAPYTQVDVARLTLE